MIYRLSAIALMGNLDSSDTRSAELSIQPHERPLFYVHSAGYTGSQSGQEAAVFDGQSSFNILRARFDPILARGLRPSLDQIFTDQCYSCSFAVDISHGNQGGYAQIFLQNFEEYESCNIIIPASGEQTRFKLAAAVINYDAYQIKDAYKNKPIYGKFSIDVDIAGEVIHT